MLSTNNWYFLGFWRSTFYANLFLYYYQNEWLLDTKKRDLRKARLFRNTFRLIDNFCVINYHLEFTSIYSSELQLEKKNISTPEVSFLGFSIIIVCMPHLDSNFPSNIYYTSTFSEFLRFTRITLNMNTFVGLSNRLLKRIHK